ncbi:hypothetical protein ETB97_001864 [Aspergillus alliaceus]|uniref:Uncharacterized protein n=1 Tax=Petromyces alliaceus TaxID=209559 RepID=A0A5N6FIR2_PETAA|nr:uncharacterized protein BDW43DRAFT_314623 [Aspergillus alliaceus]KAB8229768.1 hypothetical protein BDW43DRAFT_314623 [Aspergillus alliaceus]KAE8386886.1 hypothetical protein BDV23DRAFT_186880 [Aspergillus alliaceus]KAF5860159.1 hypothetical protein ETB97_001864 [Aspergillus burnettii]
MAAFSPIPAYVIGTLCLALGINGLSRPSDEYKRFGLPLEKSTTGHRRTIPTSGSVSPLMYLKGIREVTYGLALLAMQYQRQEVAITTLVAIFSLAGLGDGLVVWFFGGDELKKKAFGHWVTFVGFTGWSWWRAAYV